MKEKEEKIDQSIHKEALEDFKLCQDVSNDNRNDALDDLNFGRLGKQWPEKVKKQREDQGRPCLTINRLPTFIRQIVNDARQNKPQIKVHPVDDQADIETAKIYDGLIRNIETISRADIAYDTAIDYAASMGFGYIRVVIDYTCDDSFEKDILIERVANSFSVYEDPHSKSADGSDWNIAFVTETMSKKQFKEEYPDAEPIDFEADAADQKMLDWFSEDSVRVAEYWKRTKVIDILYLLSDNSIVKKSQYEENFDVFQQAGITIIDQREIESYKVKRYVINGKEILKEDDWPGIYIPIIPVYGEEINVQGKRILQSLIRQAKDSQQNFNYWRSCATELVALAPKAPWVGPVGAFKKDDGWNTANTENHPYLEYDGQIPPQRQPFAGMPAGALQEAASAADDLKSILGMYDASLGARSNETSGRAIMARQKEGDTSTFNFTDNLNRAIRQVGAVLINLIPSVYSKPRIIRILGEDGTPKNVPVNQNVMIDQKGEIIGQGKPIPEDAISRIYDLTAGKYDLTVSSGPSFNTRREEAAFQMTEFVRAFPQAAPVIGDILAKNLDWPGADEIADRLKAINPVLQKEQHANQPPPPDPEMIKNQQKMQMDLQKAEHDAMLAEKKAHSDLALKQADLVLKEKDITIKDQEIIMKKLEIEAQREKNECEIVKVKMGLEAQSRKNQHEQYMEENDKLRSDIERASQESTQWEPGSATNDL